MSTVPYKGHHAGVADAVGCLVTLGTPHDLHKLRTRYRHGATTHSIFSTESRWGVPLRPRTRYLTVGGILGFALPRPVQWATGQAFSVIIGEQMRTPAMASSPRALRISGARRASTCAASATGRSVVAGMGAPRSSTSGGRSRYTSGIRRCWRDWTRSLRISGRGVEQRQLVGLITRRSAVRIRPPQPPHLD